MKNLFKSKLLNYSRLDEASKIKETTKLKYRKALTYYNLKDYEKASELFNSVMKQDNSMNEDIQCYMKRIREQEKKNEEKSKIMFQKFFNANSDI